MIHAGIQKYKEDDNYRDALIQAGIQKYQEDENYRDTLIEYGIHKYQEDEDYRKALYQSGIEKYKDDNEYREKLKQASIHKYEADANHKEHVKQASVHKYEVDVNHKEHVKQASIYKLEAYDRNQDFGGQEDLGEDFSMSLPELSKYKDMNTETEFVDFKMGAVETYLEQMDKSLDCDASNLYKEKISKKKLALRDYKLFTKSKRFKGSPIKACDLSVSAVRASNVNFDPRPRASQNTSNYQDYFRNICLNHKYGSTLPIVQLYPPANIYGVVTDHDYFEFHPEDKWLSENCISTITDEEISKIESFTSGQAKNPRICKATERTDFEKLARSMTEIVDLKTAPILHGQKYEKSALSKYEQDFGRSPVNCGIYVSKSHPFIAASPDGIINDTVVEVKCPFVAKDKMISPKTIPFLLYNDGKLMLNESHNYYYQVQGQMFCTNLKNCHFVVFTLQEVQYIHIKRDDIFIQNMVEKLEDFYKTYFRKAILQKFLYKDYDKYSFE
ncbi:unnamed protein product [Mytilus coruscus]|uniref:YqaJ viral recombinase domain-containing protein n=1 Tax=Mytilus coruscus TaxID=42192 RepID=A0A6J8BZ37_MYTCO|nr:unnamed protein product [Mytilus coruscus]